MKNIVICSDGTGNTAVKGRGTNVFKLFEAIDLNGHRTNPDLLPQIALYDDGVGTESFKPLKIFAGATGFGLSRNVKQLYKELVRIYDPGDRIFLFGFSRGAFTARSLSGMITTCGILDAAMQPTARALEAAVEKAYKTYRRRYRTALAKLFLREPAPVIAQAPDSSYHEEKARIAFIGVWDTVDAVGMPFYLSDFVNLTIYRFKFPDRILSEFVDRACHALSVDDQRHSFRPLLWNADPNDDRRIEQVWFSGAHSNVGGGYPKQGMSLVALDWMMQRAENAGLRILASDRAVYREHTNVDDKLYDPRAGLGAFYRWKPRDMAAMCEENNLQPAIHLSVFERIAHGTEDYAPGNLALKATVVFTQTGDPEKDAAAGLRASAVEMVLKSAFAHAQSILTRAGVYVAIGRIAYYLYLVAGLAVVIGMVASKATRSALNPLTLLSNAKTVIAHMFRLRFGEAGPAMVQFLGSSWLVLFVLVVLLVAWGLARFADVRMSATYSQFWHKVQPELRTALKRAREIARAIET